MYFSKISLDTTKRDTQAALNCPNVFHGAVEKSLPKRQEAILSAKNGSDSSETFDEKSVTRKKPAAKLQDTLVSKAKEENRCLWSIEDSTGNKELHLLSMEKPEMAAIQEQFGFADQPAAIVDYDLLLDKVENGTQWFFKLQANPTFSQFIEGKRGKVTAQSDPFGQETWIETQALKHGFKIVPFSLSLTEGEWKTFKKSSGHSVNFLTVTFKGKLEVTDSEKFKQVLQKGLGREKGFGQGFLHVIQV